MVPLRMSHIRKKGQKHCHYQIQALGGISLWQGGLSIHGGCSWWPSSQDHSLQMMLLDTDPSRRVPWPPRASLCHTDPLLRGVQHPFSQTLPGLFVLVLVLYEASIKLQSHWWKDLQRVKLKAERAGRGKHLTSTKRKGDGRRWCGSGISDGSISLGASCRLMGTLAVLMSPVSSHWL